jgi:hypothetical protein
MHCQAADVATGKEQGRDDMAVGGNGNASARWRQDGLVITLRQPVVGKFGGKQLAHQLGHGAATTAVGEVDQAVLEVERTGVGLAHAVAPCTKRP